MTMAFLRDIERSGGVQGCRTPARVELLGYRNQSFGYFCRTHGKRRCRELNAQEQRDRERA